ncbi:hypothetical protein [Candidatus Mesenet endosymbiont of Phosphuga atrata]|uniref:hypothetical protein n=1 Tax=Candidatus Mesenet endosymbiont of Phosphuga atrata TaxID=3066221 RepID=UPI0030CBBBA5
MEKTLNLPEQISQLKTDNKNYQVQIEKLNKIVEAQKIQIEESTGQCSKPDTTSKVDLGLSCEFNQLILNGKFTGQNNELDTSGKMNLGLLCKFDELSLESNSLEYTHNDII